MKKIIASLLLAGYLVVPNSVGCSSDAIDSQASVSQLLADVPAFIEGHKKEVFLLAAALTIALSLKYCSWMRGVAGLDTEDEISDWKEFIQPD